VRTVTHGEPLPINDIIYQLHEVVRMANNRSAGSVLPVGAFTTAHRDLAARTLNALLTGKCRTMLLIPHVLTNIPEDVNRKSFVWVQTASFVLCLDKSTDCLIGTLPVGDMNKEELRLAHEGHHILHGHGTQMNALNRWCDKTQHVRAHALTTDVSVEYR
jgi:hypothetical protein